MRENERIVDPVEALWRQHHKEVRDFLALRCGDRHLAEDLTAETFLQAARSIAKGSEVTVGWLITVARRRLMDHWRASYRASAMLERLTQEPITRAVGELETVEAGPMGQALDLLCDTQRSALYLRYVTDRSVQDVADRLSLSYSATESLLSRGRRRLEQEYIGLGVA